jgi:hypothetical protein
MRWSVTLVGEVEPGRMTEHEIASFERSDGITPATLGLSIAEGKAVLAAIQAHVVMDHVKRHGQVAGRCVACGRTLTSKGHSRVIMANKEQAWETRVARKTRKKASNSR